MALSRRGKAALVATVLGAVLIGCGGPDVSRYQSLVDKLVIPADWQLVHTTIHRPGGPDHEVKADRATDAIDCAPLVVNCPSVTRTYLAPGMPIDLLPVAKRILGEAGYGIGEVIRPGCDGDGPACLIKSVEGTDEVTVNLFNPGDDIQGLGVSKPDHSIIIVAAAPKK